MPDAPGASSSGGKWIRITQTIGLFVVVTGFLVGGLVAFAVLGIQNAHTAVAARFDGSRPECAHMWDDPKASRTDSRASASAAGSLSDVPEFHDCQRLVVSDSLGPLVAIFAADSLSSIIPNPGDLPVRWPEIRAAAEILNLDSTDYRPLGILPKSSCLYIWPTAKRIHLRARIVPVRDDFARCRAFVDTSMIVASPGMDLEVVRTLAPSQDQPPAVARWDWHDSLGVHFIGIACGSFWCEVGTNLSQWYAGGTPPSRPHAPVRPVYNAATRIVRWDPDGPPITPGERRVRTTKGWYDEQRLSIVKNGTTALTNVRGTVFPHPELNSYSGNSYRKQWKVVAYVALSAPLPQYREKFNFVHTPPGAGFNEMSAISLCYGTSGVCEVPLSDLLFSGKVSRSCGGFIRRVRAMYVERWWARIKSPDGVALNLCMTRRAHPTVHSMAATARWRWLALDETTWDECATGCCEVLAMDDGSIDGGDPPEP